MEKLSEKLVQLFVEHFTKYMKSKFEFVHFDKFISYKMYLLSLIRWIKTLEITNTFAYRLRVFHRK